MAADTCRLCLRPIDKAKSSNLLTETTKFAMLKEFLPDMNLDISENTEVCNNCMGELETSYNYKNGVVANEANIQAKLKGKKQKKIDLKLMLDGVAKKELKKGDHICRTCLSICKSPSISLFDSPSNMMPYSFVKEMCEAVFELEFIASAKPVLCDDCWETLQTVYNFRKSCLRIDQRLRTYVASKNVKKLSIDEFKKFAEENPVKEEDEDSSDEEINGYIKDEPIDEEELKIDPEEASCSSSSVKVKDETEVKSESELNSDDEDMEDEPDLLDPKALKSEASEPDGEDCKMEIGDVKVDTEGEGAAGTSGEEPKAHSPQNQNESGQPLDNVFTTGQPQRDNAALLFSCPQCSYGTNYKHNLKTHMLVHQDDTMQLFSCTHCTFTTKYKHSLQLHLITHQTSHDSVQMFLCTHCSFTTKQKRYLDSHLITHQPKDTGQMFSCTICSFTTKRKAYLKGHLITHQPDDTVKMFSCAHCSFNTKHRKSLRCHLISHQPDDVVPVISCTQCSFKTKIKNRLKSHVLVHKTNDTIRMFSCSNCSFTTKRKGGLKKHMLVHQRNDTGFSCPNCAYSTKRKGCLKRHFFNRHSDEVYQHKFFCTLCSFKTDHKFSLKRHKLVH